MKDPNDPTPEDFQKQLTEIETGIETLNTKAAEEVKNNGKMHDETKNAIEEMGNKQRELADDLLELKQKGVLLKTPEEVKTMGLQVVESENYKSYVAGGSTKMRVEVKNTLVGSDANVAPDRKPGIVAGAFLPLTLEMFLNSLPTVSNAIEYTRELAFTDNAAERTEGAAMGESALTWELKNMPVSNISHFIRISKQLANDSAALAIYVDTRMRYGVNRRVEVQLGAGDGVAPNISGILDAGNFTAHGIADADLGTVLKKLVLIRKVIAALSAAGDQPDAILLNPADWGDIEIDIFTSTAGLVRVNVDAMGHPILFGLPVIQSIGITSGQVVVGNFAQAATVHNREGVVVEMSDSDATNFTTGLITIRAERRAALTVERPAAIQAGDLTPA